MKTFSIKKRLIIFFLSLPVIFIFTIILVKYISERGESVIENKNTYEFQKPNQQEKTTDKNKKVEDIYMETVKRNYQSDTMGLKERRLKEQKERDKEELNNLKERYLEK